MFIFYTVKTYMCAKSYTAFLIYQDADDSGILNIISAVKKVLQLNIHGCL